MEKTAAENYLIGVSSYAGFKKGDDTVVTWETVIDWLDDHASQQCAALKEQHKQELKDTYSAGLMCERILAKEENERLREALQELLDITDPTLPEFKRGIKALNPKTS